MVPALTEGGRSFKGAALYYLHDKQAASSERVAWTETINLRTVDAEKAWRIMAFTALAQAELKTAAGVKATGRKLDKPVLAYSLAWHPDETPGREDMLEAARETLKVLGLEDHQALIVCHNDEPHAHVHVLVNRVHPGTGKAATLSNSKRKLSAWALKYEKERGPILCPQREENAKKREQGEFTKDPREPRKEYEAKIAAAANQSLTFDFVRQDQKAKDARLKAQERAMEESHRGEWRQMSELYRSEKAKLAVGRDMAMTQAQAGARELHASQRLGLKLRHDAERLSFHRREGSFIGFVVNALRTVRELRAQAREEGRDDPAAHDALTLFVAALNSRERRDALSREHRRERETMRKDQKAELDSIAMRHWKQFLANEGGLKSAFAERFQQLKTQQAEGRQQMKAAWRQRRKEYSQAMEPYRNKAAAFARLREQAQKGRGMERTRELTRRPPPKPKEP